jgi:Domain of unknown function (DUF4279)
MVIGSERITADEISRRLSLDGATSAEIGQVMPGVKARPRPKATWEFTGGTDLADGSDLTEEFERLLSAVSSCKEQLWLLFDEGHSIKWSCLIQSTATEHAAVLSHQLLRELHEFPGDLYLDFQELASQD